jgi:ABC-type lipoprotein release transport system permease subunit
MLDRTLAVTALGDLQTLLALPSGRIHEVAARLDDPETAAGVVAALARAPALPAGARAVSWETLAPALVEYLRLLRGWNWITLLIVGTFAAFGVLNTMLMAVFERTREMGVLVALGLGPSRLLGMILAESACLAAVGLAAGAGLGTVGMTYFAWHGWDLSRWAAGLTIAGVLVDPVLRGTITWQSLPSIGASLGAITILAALVPALRAARLRPVQALAAPVE